MQGTWHSSSILIFARNATWAWSNLAPLVVTPVQLLLWPHWLPAHALVKIRPLLRPGSDVCEAWCAACQATPHGLRMTSALFLPAMDIDVPVVSVVADCARDMIPYLGVLAV